mmetsp:Transcript_19373/g.34218  ORF Transcript_19373/g.34218 Transcript_19373/m.34218 type:complete len:178 (-) Transcript_19373:769-1302(-)
MALAERCTFDAASVTPRAALQGVADRDAIASLCPAAGVTRRIGMGGDITPCAFHCECSKDTTTEALKAWGVDAGTGGVCGTAARLAPVKATTVWDAVPVPQGRVITGVATPLAALEDPPGTLGGACSMLAAGADGPPAELEDALHGEPGSCAGSCGCSCGRLDKRRGGTLPAASKAC